MVNDAEHIGGIHALGSLGEVGEVNKVKILAGHVGNNLRSGQAELVENELGFRSGSALSGGLHVLAEFFVQVRDSNGRNDTVGIRIHVADNKSGHTVPPLEVSIWQRTRVWNTAFLKTLLKIAQAQQNAKSPDKRFYVFFGFSLI